MWLALDLRRRWLSLTVLALLVALTSATIMATIAGARRGATAIERLQARTLPATVIVLANLPGFDWEKVRALPDVEALTTFIVDYAITGDGRPGDLLVPPVAFDFPHGDDNALRTIERPVVYAGRLPDPTRADEAVVTRQFVANHHLGIGDTVTIHLPTLAELKSTATGSTLTSMSGPTVSARIVGVVASPWFSDQPGSTGHFIPSPGLTARYPLEVKGDPNDKDNPNVANALIRLRGGEAAIPAFQQRFSQLTGRNDIEIWNMPEKYRELQRHATFEAQCLLAVALAVFAAALFLVGQALVRYAAGSAIELTTLRALGMTPRQTVLTATVGPVLAGVAGVLLGGAGAIAASPLFPFGTGGLWEPDPGDDVDALVLGAVALLVVVLVAAGTAAAAWLALAAGRAEAATRRSSVVSAVQRLGLGVPVLVGTRFALEPGRGRTAVPVRPALIGAVTGVLGVIAAFTFSYGVADAAANPARYGQTFQLANYVGFNNQDFVNEAKVSSVIAADQDVTGLNDAKIGIATGPDTSVTVALFSYEAGPKPLPVVVTDGRLPKEPGEVLLAPHSLTALHAAIGDQVTLTGDQGTARLTVTGVGLTPIVPHNNYSEGGFVSPAGFASLFKGFTFHINFIAVRPGADLGAVSARLGASVGAAIPKAPNLTFDQAEAPPELSAIRQVQSLPLALGAFLALLAIGAVGHALATAVRRRRHDVAVLRAVGMTRWQSRGVLVTQASVLAVAGLALGVPLGLALGRTVWRVVADYTPLQYVAPLAFWVLLLVGPASLLVANLLAAWPGRQVARLRIGHVLRAE